MRYTEVLRNNLTDLQNMKITYRDFNTGQVRQVPISSVVKFDYNNSLGGVKRKNLKRMITIYSNLIGWIWIRIESILRSVMLLVNSKASQIILPSGKQVNRKSNRITRLLGTALIIALGMIFGILVLQFNSLSKPFIVSLKFSSALSAYFLDLPSREWRCH